jgi:hypothetical protein
MNARKVIPLIAFLLLAPLTANAQEERDLVLERLFRELGIEATPVTQDEMDRAYALSEGWPPSWPQEVVEVLSSQEILKLDPHAPEGAKTLREACAILHDIDKLMAAEKDVRLTALTERNLTALLIISAQCLMDVDEGEDQLHHSMFWVYASVRTAREHRDLDDRNTQNEAVLAELVAEYDDLVKRYNGLVDKYNRLADTSRELTQVLQSEIRNHVCWSAYRQLLALPPPVSLRCTATTFDYGGFQRSRINCY